ncbi:MAG: hypothetical protein U9R16_05670 [Campylobacterota bacterium]|nr:hypothetical protein [Campylobacterota bacterium]
MKKIESDFSSSSLNTLIIQKQSQNNHTNSSTFSSLLKEGENRSDTEVISTNLNNKQMELQNRAYLNRLVLGFVA